MSVLSSIPEPLLYLLLAVGAIKLIRLSLSFLAVASETLLPRKAALQAYRPKSGRGWAIVTGATAGIGEQFAHQLAASGFNVALVSRTLPKLEAVGSEIRTKHNVETAVFALDALTATALEYATFHQFVDALGSVSVLINNVGVSHEMPTPFTELSQAEAQGIIQINCVATLEITRAVLPALLRSREASKSRGLVLTMGSFAGLTPTPLLSVYSGSKLFLQGWSSALAEELKPLKVDVQLVLSYLVVSQMSKIRRTSALIPSPRAFVKSTLKSIGRRGGAQERAYTLTPYWSHAFMHWAIENTLGVYSQVVAKINYGMHVDIRKRALWKKAKTQ